MQVSAVVLAGGRSTRMGADKALLRIGERTVLERTVDVLHRLTDDVLVVGRAPETDVAAQFLLDQVAGHGPLGGLYTGLRHARFGYVICVSCDLPFVSADALGFLLSRTTGHDAVVPAVGGRLQVLHAIYSRGVAPVAERHLVQGRNSMHAFLRGVSVYAVSEVELREVDPELRSFCNVNTPEEWQAALDALKT